MLDVMIMSEFLKSLSVSASGLKAQAQRVRHVSENIANADTPGYRAQDITPFAEIYDRLDPGQPAARDRQEDEEQIRQGQARQRKIRQGKEAGLGRA